MLHGGPTHGGPGIMIVYDITNLDSFNHVENWLGEIAVKPAIPSRAPFQHATPVRPPARRPPSPSPRKFPSGNLPHSNLLSPPAACPPGGVLRSPIGPDTHVCARARAAHPCVCATCNMMRQGCGVRTAHAGAHVRRIRDQGCHRQQVGLGREADGRNRQRTGLPLHRTPGAPYSDRVPTVPVTLTEYPRRPLLL
jgi:hypothetical protein